MHPCREGGGATEQLEASRHWGHTSQGPGPGAANQNKARTLLAHGLQVEAVDDAKRVHSLEHALVLIEALAGQRLLCCCHDDNQSDSDTQHYIIISVAAPSRWAGHADHRGVGGAVGGVDALRARTSSCPFMQPVGRSGIGSLTGPLSRRGRDSSKTPRAQTGPGGTRWQCWSLTARRLSAGAG